MEKEKNAEKKTMTKRKKLTIVAVTVIVVAVAIGAGIYLHNPLDLKSEAVTVEYGQAISTDAKDYLKKDVDKNIVKNTEVTYKTKPVEGQTYDQVGEYIVRLKYEKKTAEVTVTVEDTTKPEFNATAESGIETIEGVELNFAELITAADLAGAEVTFDADGVDLTTPGTYTLKATATDPSGNKVKKDISVNVAEKPANMTGSSVSVDPATGKVTVKAKTSSSSSSSRSNKSKSSSGSGGSVTTNKTGESSIGDGRTGEDYEEFTWPSDWN